MYRILVTGDLVISRNYDASRQIDKELSQLFSDSHLNISNLEAPVTDTESKILKTGPYLKSDEKSLEDVLKHLNIHTVTLANNHLMDYGERGVSDTMHFCDKLGVKTVGAGSDIHEASKTLFIETGEGKIAIVNFAENEWSSATEDSAGANPMDVIDNSNQIKKAKELADFVFVIIHGGHEYYNLPSPRMQKQYRFYAEQGADIVIGHHTHCISGYEEYKGVPIYYSLGNFLFTKNSNKEDWYVGLLLNIEIEDGKLYSYIQPVGQKKDSFNLSLLKDKEKNDVVERIEEYNHIIDSHKRLSEEWRKYVNLKSRQYLNCWSPLTYFNYSYLPAIFNKLKITVSSKKGASLFLNLMRCEAHHDISKEILAKHLKK